MSNWYWYIILFLIGYPLSILFHELSHTVYVWIKGGVVSSFKVWPHKPDGKWAMGSIDYYVRTYSHDERTMCLVPLMTASILFGVTLWCGLLWHPLWMFTIWMVKEWVVFIKNLVYGDIGTDGGDYGIMTTEDLK